jgi:A/G-specific adenine glycosylase
VDIVTPLTNWYQQNKRPLPWRQSKDPYKIWLSEVIMQQTRIAQGTSYYLRFVETYPSVKHLANAPLDAVLKLWEGLGYYSRARNLHAAANQIMTDFQGTFPTLYDDLITIKGIGPYTAAAISSICFNEQKAVVDGNVFRVLARLHGIDTPINSTAGKKIFQALADDLIIQTQKPGDFNQAMMEFGAIHCTPKKPLCADCLFQDKCAAYQTGLVNKLPVKQKAKPLRNRYLHYFIIKNDLNIWIQQRQSGDIWSHLYEFPLFESEKQIIQPKKLATEIGLESESPSRLAGPIKHILSHQRLHITFWQLPSTEAQHFSKAKPLPFSNLEKLALPIALKRFVEANLLPLQNRPQ